MYQQSNSHVIMNSFFLFLFTLRVLFLGHHKSDVSNSNVHRGEYSLVMLN